jgi:hypothetical protein
MGYLGRAVAEGLPNYLGEVILEKKFGKFPQGQKYFDNPRT